MGRRGRMCRVMAARKARGATREVGLIAVLRRKIRLDRFCPSLVGKVGGIMNNNILPPSDAHIRKAFFGTKQEQAIYRREFYEACRRFMRFVHRNSTGITAKKARRAELAITHLLRRMNHAKA